MDLAIEKAVPWEKALMKEVLMSLMLLAGVWALAFGHITVTNSIKSKGNECRVFGLALILVAAYGLPHLNEFFNRYMPQFISGNEAFRQSYELLIGAIGVYLTGWFFNIAYPKLKIPVLSISMNKKRRAA